MKAKFAALESYLIKQIMEIKEEHGKKKKKIL